jgi:peptidoglycan hydrolase-like protein with peptidoglycan-binding domain
MATAQDEKQILQQVNGKTEHPANSNRIFVWTDLIKKGLAEPYFNGQPYCAGGIVWTNMKVKSPQLSVQSPFYVPSRQQWARAHGFYVAHPSPSQVDLGDELIFAFTQSARNSGLGEHVERVVGVPKGNAVRTFGFNTSSGTYGSQDNGGGCFFRTRSFDATLIGVIKYSRLLDKSRVPTNKVRKNPWAAALRKANLPISINHHSDHDAIRAVQWAVGVPVDGVFGECTDHAVRHFQRYHVDRNHQRLVSDGEVGRLTREQILRITHHEH